MLPIVPIYLYLLFGFVNPILPVALRSTAKERDRDTLKLNDYEPVIDPPLTSPPPPQGPRDAPGHIPTGWFRVVGESGVPAMHAALLPNGKVIFLDKVENYTQIKLANGRFAYSAEYDPVTKELVGLPYEVSDQLRSCSDMA